MSTVTETIPSKPSTFSRFKRQVGDAAKTGFQTAAAKQLGKSKTAQQVAQQMTGYNTPQVNTRLQPRSRLSSIPQQTAPPPLDIYDDDPVTITTVPVGTIPGPSPEQPISSEATIEKTTTETKTTGTTAKKPCSGFSGPIYVLIILFFVYIFLSWWGYGFFRTILNTFVGLIWFAIVGVLIWFLSSRCKSLWSWISLGILIGIPMLLYLFTVIRTKVKF